MKNQMWKKGVCLGMAAMMTAGMLAGCGESSESKDTALFPEVWPVRISVFR